MDVYPVNRGLSLNTEKKAADQLMPLSHLPTPLGKALGPLPTLPAIHLLVSCHGALGKHHELHNRLPSGSDQQCPF